MVFCEILLLILKNCKNLGKIKKSKSGKKHKKLTTLEYFSVWQLQENAQKTQVKKRPLKDF